MRRIENGIVRFGQHCPVQREADEAIWLVAVEWLYLLPSGRDIAVPHYTNFNKAQFEAIAANLLQHGLL